MNLSSYQYTNIFSKSVSINFMMKECAFFLKMFFNGKYNLFDVL